MKKLLIILLSSFFLYATENAGHISSFFLGVKYEAGTLIGSDTTKEKLVMKLDGVDYFTLIEYVEAMKGAVTNDEFKANLINIRYKDGIVSYKNRRHFFSDWLEKRNIKDITCETGPCINVIKSLNKKGINQVYFEGIDIVKRKISYVPVEEFDSLSLNDGDYIGIYTKKQGLDTIGAGIALNKDGTWYLRHASIKEKKVVDTELDQYLGDKDGVIVYRSLFSF
jgi:hypothetical protein